MLNEILYHVISNKASLILLGVAFIVLVFTLLSSLSPSRVRVKRRVIQQDSKLSGFAVKLISKSSMLEKIKNNIRVQLGLITSKSDSKNDYYASFTVFILIILALVALVFIILSDIPIMIKPLLYIGSIIIPYFFISVFLKGRRKRIYNDFPEFVSIYITKYVSIKNTKEALRKSIAETPLSIRHEIKRLVNSMNNSDDYYKALDEFDTRVDYVMCTAFVALLKTGYKTSTDIIPSLLDLETYIAQERLENQRKGEQLKDKKANLYFLMIGMAGAYYFISTKFGERAMNYYWHTIQGQGIIAGCIISAVVTILVIIIEDSL